MVSAVTVADGRCMVPRCCMYGATTHPPLLRLACAPPAGRSQSLAGAGAATRHLSTALCVDSSGPQPTPTMRLTLARPPRALQGTRRTFGKLQLLSSAGRSPSSPLACAQARRRDAMQERRCRAPAGRGRCHLAEGCGCPVSTHRTRHRGAAHLCPVATTHLCPVVHLHARPSQARGILLASDHQRRAPQRVEEAGSVRHLREAAVRPEA